MKGRPVSKQEKRTPNVCTLQTIKTFMSASQKVLLVGTQKIILAKTTKSASAAHQQVRPQHKPELKVGLEFWDNPSYLCYGFKIVKNFGLNLGLIRVLCFKRYKT